MVKNRRLDVGEFWRMWWERREAPWKRYVLRCVAPIRIWWVCAKRLKRYGEFAVILVSHDTYVKTLSCMLNQAKYASYWMTRGSWDPLRVIESYKYMNPKFDLKKGMKDFSCLLDGSVYCYWLKRTRIRIIQRGQRGERCSRSSPARNIFVRE